MIHGICIIGTRRTGSNHLMNLLSNFRRLEATGELFSRERIIGIDLLLPKLRRITGLAIPSTHDPVLHARAREKPGAFLEVIEEAARRRGKRAYCFKLFEDQLSRNEIEDQVLSRPGMHPVLLVRRSVDTFISLAKATSTDQWMTRDTTGLQVALDVEEFASWLAEQRNWYGHWLSRARRRGEKPVVLSYEEDIDQPARMVLRRFARMSVSLGINLRPPLLLTNRGLNRQDRNTDPSERVANWAEFIEGLDRHGLREAAFGYPL